MTEFAVYPYYRKLVEDMLPGTHLPANGTGELHRNITEFRARDLANEDKLIFTIGQPEDPKYADNAALSEYEKNVTDETTPFRHVTPMTIEMVFNQEAARGYIKTVKAEMTKRWGIGVGVGVGVGVVVVAGVMFCLGKRDEKKTNARKHIVEVNPMELDSC